MTFLTHPVAWLLPALMLVLAGTQLALPPRMRPGLWFSVTVPSDFPVSERGRRILRTYRAGVLLGSGGALVLAFGVLRNGGRWMAFAGMLLQQVSGLLAFLAARRQVLPHAVPADTTREAVLLAREEGLPGGVGLQLGPFAVLAVTALWLHSHLEDVAARLTMSALACVLLAGVSLAMLRGSRRGVPSEGSRWDFRRVALAVMLGAEYLVALLAAGALLPLAGGPGLSLAAGSVLAWAFITGVLVLFLRLGQGGTRLKPTPVRGDRTRDSVWRWGLFYVNPEDPALFIEKRFGLGYTLNFGNRWAWMILMALPVFLLMVRLVAALAR